MRYKKKNKETNQNQSSLSKITNSLSTSKESNVISDYDGSYTGVPIDNKYAKPVQDADDL
jgi:hypothetical protein